MLLKTLEYFASNLLDPTWEVSMVLDNYEHPMHQLLMNDIENIDISDLDNFVRDNHIDGFLNRIEDKELGRRSFYMVDKLQKEITKERIHKLMESGKIIKPYDSVSSTGIDLDKNNLISTKNINLKYYRFQIDNNVYELSPITGGANSSYWISKAIINCVNKSGLIFNVRLDPFRVFCAKDYRQMEFKMHVHGKPLDWNKLITLRNADFGRWFDERYKNFTDYVWSPKGHEIHFTCEEYPSFSYDGLNTSRYFHAIFNKESGLIKHCDGAIRIYNNDELESRRNFHIKDSEVRKVGTRIKVFQFDSNENGYREISQDDFSQLAVCFFVWNQDIQEYFN